ncbi:MAG TPA: PadR family transcriptional regulator [Chloroflexi bacterium]|nr:PadR family transcriptional regulator [Chloroflexota bacterium]
MARPIISKPDLMTETTFYILLSLVEPLHGYVVMKKVEEISHGTVTIGPGTLYGAFSKLEKDGLIEVVSQGSRRKSYGLTTKGKQVLVDQINKFSIMADNGQKVIKQLS